MAGRLGAMAAGALVTAGLAQAEGDPLGRYRWTSRVLVISAPTASDARLADQRTALASARRGTAERDLVVVEAIGPEKAAFALRRRLGLGDTAFRAVLVGKDGGAKLSSADPIPPPTLFATIDAMPMRRDEMNK